MQQKYSNKNGVKLLAAVMVFALAFAGVAVIVSDDSDAEVATGKYSSTTNGPLNFDASGMTYESGEFGNVYMKNYITVKYDGVSTYIVTGVLAKQDMAVTSTGFYKMWTNNTEYLYGLAFQANTSDGDKIKVGNGTEREVDGLTDCLLYVKEAGIKTVKITHEGNVKEYVIDFTGVKLSDSIATNPSEGYVVVPNSNALVSGASGKDGESGKWTYDSSKKVLTLDNYNGTEYFDGEFGTIVLVGNNTITLGGATNALKSTAGFTIKSIDGVGTLSIIMESKGDACAIESTGKVSINGVGVEIEMSEKYNNTMTSSNSYNTKAVHAGSFDIYDGSITIDVAIENYYSAFGIDAGAVDIKSSVVEINAGSRGINATGAVTVAASDVDISADQLGIRTASTGNVGVSITNESVVNTEIYGLAEGYGKAYGVSVSGAIEVQSDSILNTNGMIIYGNASAAASVNNATINNDGDFLIWETATFTNKGKLVNDGIIGVYGTLENAAGEIVNNGTINTYYEWRDVKDNMTFSATENSVTLSVKVLNIMPLADGSFLVKVEAGTSGTDKKTYLGTISGIANAEGLTSYVLDAVNESGVVTIEFNSSYEDGNYSVYASDFTFSSTKKTTDIGAADVIKTIVKKVNAVEGNITVSGGKLTNNGTMKIDNESGSIVSGGEFLNNGALAINSDVAVSGGKFSGNDAIVSKGVTITLAGDIDMSFVNSGKYSVTTDGVSSTVDYKNIIKVSGKANGVAFQTPTDSSVPKGFLAISGMGNTDSKKGATVTLVEGSATITDIIGKNMVLSVSSGATVQVLNTATATDGVVAIEDGATINMKVTTDRNTYKYGVLSYTISFANNGYTYYGSLQFALANAAEDSTLSLNGNANVNVDTVVKKGITLQFAESSVLTVSSSTSDKITLSMEDGAKFVLAKNAQVSIGSAIVSGTIVYDANEIVFDKAAFDVASGNATVTAVATSNSNSIAVSFKAIDGTITASKGVVTGFVSIDKVMNGSKLKTTGKMIVSENATVNATFVDNKYATTDVNGTLKFTADTNILGKVSGTGVVILSDGVKVVFGTEAVADVAVGNGTDAFIFDDASGTVLTESGSVDSSSQTFTVISIAKSGTTPASVAVFGSVLNGNVQSVGNTAFGNNTNAFTLGTDVVVEVPADATITIVKIGDDTTKNVAKGLLKVAGKINMKTSSTDTAVYGTLDYQITYADGNYTVYTMLSTGVSNATAGDSFTVNKDLELTDSMEVPAGVTIIIAEGKTLTVPANKCIMIGTPITTLGAVSSIEGTIALGANAFVVVYADDAVDMSKAKILDSTESKAKNSQFTLLNEVYATVYVDVTNATTALNNVKSVLVPEIDGYRFLGWNPMTSADIGSTDYEGNLKASMVQIVFKSVDGIKYYVDNVLQNTLGAPVYVEYGSTITALAASGYTGTPLVNGKAYISVTSDLKEVVGSGVSPAVAPEAPSDDGMGITDYLLIVLVVMVVILAVIVCARMMRS